MNPARLRHRGSAAQVFRPARRPAVICVVAAAVFSLFLNSPRAEQRLGAQRQQPDSLAEFRALLQELTRFSPDPCGPPYGREQDWHSYHAESLVFEKAADIVTERLNATALGTGLARDRAREALQEPEAASGEMNAAWPGQNRFHFQVLDIPPALVVKMTVGTQAMFFVFGIPEMARGSSNRRWRRVGSGEEAGEYLPQSDLELYPLRRGPSGNARFLARFGRSGCAGSIGVVYDAREWNPDGNGNLEQVIKQSGSFGLDDTVPGFPTIGRLRTDGSMITLPYCWFSAIDTWDNPSLCALDTYDVSGDNVRFRARIYNRPDLVPLAKALEYAEEREYAAVRAYCASSQLAHRLVRDIPPDFFAEEIRVMRTGNGKERLELGQGAYRFEVRRRSRRWLVVGFGLRLGRAN